MREFVALLLLGLLLAALAIGFFVYRRRRRFARQLRRGHGDYSKVKPPGGLLG